MAPAVIECRGVVKRFYLYEHRTTSLRELFVRTVLRQPIHVRQADFRLVDFNLRVEAGESVALIGRNGSGKSTVLRLVSGIYPPSEGAIETRGRLTAVIELGSSFHHELTGAENIRLYGAVMGLSRREIEERYADIVAFAEIGDFIDVPVKYYSSGMIARLAFSVAMCVEPDVLLLDEVLAVGDQAFREKCLRYLKRFRENGGTLLIVSHDLSTLRDMCTRAVWLERGSVRMNGPVNEVLDAYCSEAH